MKDESTSPARQKESITAKEEELDAVHVGWAEDYNVSASEVEPFSRPGLGPWLTERVDEYDVLLFWKQDRAARSMQDMTALLQFAKTHRKVLVICENPGSAVYDFSEGGRTTQEQMFAEFGSIFFSFAADLEVQNIRQRVSSAQAYLRVRGLWGGGTFPFGYEPLKREGDKGYRLYQHPETYPIVREIVERLIDGDTQLEIATDLNNRKIPSPRDYWDAQKNKKKRDKPRRWSTTTIGKMARSRALLGESEYEGRAVFNKEGVPVGRSPEPIVTSEEWTQLQAALAEKSINKTRYSEENALLQVARCGQCGGPYYTKETTTKGRTYRHLVCRNRQAVNGNCTQPALTREAVEEIFEKAFMSLVKNLPVMRRQYVLGDDKAEELAEVIRLRKSLQLERDLGLLPNDVEYFERLRDFVERQRQLEGQPARKAGYVWSATGRTYEQVWDDLEPAARRRLLLDLGVRAYIGLPGQFDAGEQEWCSFIQGLPDLPMLPGNSEFNGSRLTSVDVARALGGTGENVSHPRRGEARSMTYAKKSFEFCLVRVGDVSIPAKLGVDS